MHYVLNYFRLLIFIVGILLGLGMGRNDESKSENNRVNPSNAEGDLTPGHAKVPVSLLIILPRLRENSLVLPASQFFPTAIM